MVVWCFRPEVLEIDRGQWVIGVVSKATEAFGWAIGRLVKGRRFCWPATPLTLLPINIVLRCWIRDCYLIRWCAEGR